MKIKPVGSRVLIKQKAEEKTAGGIYLPASADEDTKQGVVVAVGSAEKMPVKAGDSVVYDPSSATEMNVDGEKHIIIKTENIIAIIEG